MRLAPPLSSPYVTHVTKAGRAVIAQEGVRRHGQRFERYGFVSHGLF
ncbi:hypothetical protein [Streptomyces sp. NPDC006638]